jgi:hypothetical protein
MGDCSQEVTICNVVSSSLAAMNLALAISTMRFTVRDSRWLEIVTYNLVQIFPMFSANTRRCLWAIITVFGLVFHRSGRLLSLTQYKEGT